MYGRDQALIAILRGEERKIAESPVERREGYSGRPAAMAGGYYQNGYEGYQNGGNFFSPAFRRRLRRSAAGAAPARGARPSVVGFPIKNARQRGSAAPLRRQSFQTEAIGAFFFVR